MERRTRSAAFTGICSRFSDAEGKSGWQFYPLNYAQNNGNGNGSKANYGFPPTNKSSIVRDLEKMNLAIRRVNAQIARSESFRGALAGPGRCTQSL